ncbi:hypothetical protein [Yoonia vestfoldensis]|uniref:hypothetical protein n=1 Tax=Yoonia vestfoldensis TaxID=245188 RepID=UPI00138FA136|nr:hypothetical protein [Yoonia vestfoldensis]
MVTTISARNNLRAVTVRANCGVAPGAIQAGFGAKTVLIGVVEQKASFFALDLTGNDACFDRAYPVAVGAAVPLDI